MTGHLLNPAEALRDPASSMAPDPLTGMFAGQILLSLEAHHADIARVQLSPAVPEATAIQFETARICTFTPGTSIGSTWSPRPMR
jgi:hypothetical protein